MNITQNLSNILIFIAIIGTGLIAGTFFIFSAAVMAALGRITIEGMRAMQSINLVILNPIFLGVFMGSALISLVLVGLSVWKWQTLQAYYILAGAAFYVIGSFIVTIALNVPLNNALLAADATTTAGQEVWKNYLTNWTFWNHIRTAASILSTAAFALAFAAK